eukprot:gene17803-biopygen14975
MKSRIFTPVLLNHAPSAPVLLSHVPSTPVLLDHDSSTLWGAAGAIPRGTRRAADASGLAAADYEGFKRTFGDTADECARDGITFVPMIFEPSGGCGPSARDVFHRLARGGSAGADVQPAVFALQHRQKWSVLVRQLHARAVLRRLHDSLPVADTCVLSPAQEAAEAAAAAREASWLAAQRSHTDAPAAAGLADPAPGLGSMGCAHGDIPPGASVARAPAAGLLPCMPTDAAVPAATCAAAAPAAT